MALFYSLWAQGREQSRPRTLIGHRSIDRHWAHSNPGLGVKLIASSIHNLATYDHQVQIDHVTTYYSHQVVDSTVALPRTKPRPRLSSVDTLRPRHRQSHRPAPVIHRPERK
jgi:hypothetical protein